MVIITATLILLWFVEIVVAMSGSKQSSKGTGGSPMDLDGTQSEQRRHGGSSSGVRKQDHQMKGHARARITSSSSTSHHIKEHVASQHGVDERRPHRQSSSTQATQAQKSAVGHSSSGLWYKDVLRPNQKRTWTTIHPPKSDDPAHRSARDRYEMKERALADGKFALVTNKKCNGKLETTSLRGYTWEAWANHFKYRVPGINFPAEEEESASKNDPQPRHGAP